MMLPTWASPWITHHPFDDGPGAAALRPAMRGERAGRPHGLDGEAGVGGKPLHDGTARDGADLETRKPRSQCTGQPFRRERHIEIVWDGDRHFTNLRLLQAAACVDGKRDAGNVT